MPPTGPPPDPYAVLGISSVATDDEVRTAYRARSMLLHPDLHQGRPDHVRREAERAMVQLTEAYEAVLRDRAGRHGASAPAGDRPPLAYRLGRVAARTKLARDAQVAGEQDGGVAYRLGWLMGRRKKP